jgi:hypothetical protein
MVLEYTLFLGGAPAPAAASVDGELGSFFFFQKHRKIQRIVFFFSSAHS